MRDIKLKKWNNRKIVVTTIGAGAVAFAGIMFFPKYGLLNQWDKEWAVAEVEQDYERTVDSLEAATDSLSGELAMKDSALAGAINTYETELAQQDSAHTGKLKSLASRYTQDIEREKEEHQRLAKSAEEESRRLRAESLDSFLAKYPKFDKNRDYISSIGYWGSKPKQSAVDVEGYVTLKRSLELMLEGRPERLVINVLEGKAVLMSGEVAKTQTRDISVDDATKYFFVADENGNPKGYGMDFDQYEAEIGGK